MRKFVGENIKEAEGLTITQITSLIRAQVRRYIKTNDLQIKASVRCKHHTSIQVSLSNVPTYYLNPAYDETVSFFDRIGSPYTEEGLRVLENIKRIHQQYNYDNSEIETDYFDVRYYGQVSFDRQSEQITRQKMNSYK